jgi:DNA-binding MarR family transcriptional regulator
MARKKPEAGPPPENCGRWLGRLLYQAASGMRADMERRLAPLGLSVPHVIVLATLARQGSRSQMELGCASFINRSSMVGLLDDLERLGLAERKRDPHDRRVYVVHLSDAGRDALARADEARAAVERRWLAPLAPAERTRFLRLLARVAAVGGDEPHPSPCPEG